jgi:TetR/AcrR family transcriptional regulator
MPKPTFLNLPEDKRERIVELAIEEFSDKPYAQASISNIVAQAGIAKGSFYQYFEDKLDLYRWLLLDVAGHRKLAYIEARVPSQAADMFELLEHLLLAGLEFGIANPRLSRVAEWTFHRTPDPELAAFLAEVEALSDDNFRRFLVQARDRGELREGLDLDVAAAVLGVTLRTGLDVAMKRRFGFDLWEMCTNPRLARKVSKAERARLARDLVDVLRHGLASGRASAGARFDPDEARAMIESAVERS